MDERWVDGCMDTFLNWPPNLRKSHIQPYNKLTSMLDIYTLSWCLCIYFVGCVE